MGVFTKDIKVYSCLCVVILYTFCLSVLVNEIPSIPALINTRGSDVIYLAAWEQGLIVFACLREFYLTSCCFGRCAVTNDGLSSDLQVWDLGGDDSGEFHIPEAPLCEVTAGLPSNHE